MRFPTVVVIAVLVAVAFQPLDVVSGKIEYDDMTINWSVETIDGGARIVPGDTSIAVGPSGTVHVTYHDGDKDGLRYAFKPPDGNWSTELVDAPGVGAHSEVVVDSKGDVHVAYEDRVDGTVKYATRLTDGGWDVSTVDGPVACGNLTMEIDAEDNVFIAYVDLSTPSIDVATPDGAGGWNVTTVVEGGHLYWGMLDMAIWSNGSKHLVYLASEYNSGYLQAYHAHWWPGEVWRVEAEPFLDSGVSHLSIAFNDDGIPYVAAHGGYTLLHRAPSGHWGDFSYFKDQHFRSYGDIRYDSQGCWMVCGQTSSDDLRYYEITPVGNFRTGTVDGRAGTGGYASMAVGPEDRHHIVYYDESNGTLEHATDANRASAPESLTATGGERDITLEWGMPDDLGNATTVTFNIYREDPEDFENYIDLYRTGWTGTSFIDTDVENRVSYLYYVVAVNGAGEGIFSNRAWAMPLLHPTAPRNVTAMAGPDNVVLSWEPPADPGVYTVTGYRVHWRTGTYWSGFGPEWQYPVSEWSNFTVGAATMAFNHSGLKQGYSYHYEIAALHAGGEGERSHDVNAIPMVPPGPPTALTAVRGDGRVVLNWTRPVDDGGCRLTAYRVYRGTSPMDLRLVTTINGSAGDFNLWNEPSMRLMDDGAVPEVVGWDSEGRKYIIPKDSYGTSGELGDSISYYYQVSAVQLAGEGSRSSVLEVPPEMTPRAPRNLTATAVGEGVRLSWMPPARDYYFAPSGYVIYRIGPDGELTVVDLVGKETFNYLDKGVVSNSTYRYCVRGVNEAGEGNSSEWAEVPVGVVIPAHEPPGDGWHWPLADLAFAIAVALIILAVLMMRKRAERRKRGN